jgi:hypothetical protein
MSDTKLDIHSKIDQLPPERRAEAEDFIDFLREKSRSSSKNKQRTFGSAEGMIEMSEDFDEPLEDFRKYRE